MAETDSSALFSLRSLSWGAGLLGIFAGSRRATVGSTTGTARRSVMHFHRSARLQAFLPIHHHLIADRNPGSDQGNISLRQIHFDGLHICFAGFYGVDVRTL